MWITYLENLFFRPVPVRPQLGSMGNPRVASTYEVARSRELDGSICQIFPTRIEGHCLVSLLVSSTIVNIQYYANIY